MRDDEHFVLCLASVGPLVIVPALDAVCGRAADGRTCKAPARALRSCLEQGWLARRPAEPGQGLTAYELRLTPEGKAEVDARRAAAH